jgi:hypothetical protein
MPWPVVVKRNRPSEKGKQAEKEAGNQAYVKGRLAGRQTCRHASRHADSQVVHSQATLRDEIMKQLLL